MNDFTFYFSLGWQHIINWDALDHLMFITALTAVYLPANWKQVLILITAFTIGHSLTLALSTYDVIRFNAAWVEFLVPLTIVITALLNLFQKDFQVKKIQANYFLALFFGLIHGMGFANSIRFMLAKQQRIAVPLFGFNIGLEAGQIVVVLIILLLNFVVVNKAGLPARWWVFILSGTVLCIASYMCIDRWPL
ncbi:MAG: HupE/UreJ family protein [Ferruginibacter sp.]